MCQLVDDSVRNRVVSNRENIIKPKQKKWKKKENTILKTAHLCASIQNKVKENGIATVFMLYEYIV